MRAVFHYRDGHSSESHDGSLNIIKIEWENGCIEYQESGKLHRVDGPALIHADGSREYWINGNRRPAELGPSIEWADGTIIYEPVEEISNP